MLSNNECRVVSHLRGCNTVTEGIRGVHLLLGILPECESSNVMLFPWVSVPELRIAWLSISTFIRLGRGNLSFESVPSVRHQRNWMN